MFLLVFDDLDWLEGVEGLGEYVLFVFWVCGDCGMFGWFDCLIVIVGVCVVIGYGEYVMVEVFVGLVDWGFMIVLGVVYGIDGIVYWVVLVSLGLMVVFFVGGVDCFYFVGYEVLFIWIVEWGVVVLEVLCGIVFMKWCFL